MATKLPEARKEEGQGYDGSIGPKKRSKFRTEEEQRKIIIIIKL